MKKLLLESVCVSMVLLINCVVQVSAQSIEKDGKKYFAIGQRVGVDVGKQVPVTLYGGAPFMPKTLKVDGELKSALTIVIVGYDGKYLIPDQNSPTPLFMDFDTTTGSLRSKMFTHAINVTWQFPKSGISFDTKDGTYVIVKPGATIHFTKDGVKVKGIHIEIEVDPAVVKEVSSWQRKLMLFTSAANPIHSLKDIILSKDSQIGYQLPYTFQLLPKLTKLFELDGVTITENVIDEKGKAIRKLKVETLGMGNGYFPKLFVTHPNLRLFMTVILGPKEEKTIVESGKGIRVTFKATPVESRELGTPYQHEAFNIIVPMGWKTVKTPEQGFEIGFTHGKTPNTKWYLHYELMLKAAGEPPSDAATLNAMASQFHNLVRQQFPGAKKLTPNKRIFPGKTLVHLLYELRENGTTVYREYVYLFAYGTAYVIRSTVPKARRAEFGSAIDVLFRTFRPRPGAKPIARTAAQALKNLKTDLPKLTASMPIGWRASIREIKFLKDTPKKGDISLFIAASWPRRELEKEFSSAKKAISLWQRGETVPATITQASVDLVYYVGQLLGLASGEVYGLKPEVTYLVVSMLDPKDKEVGFVRIRTKDLMKIIGRDIQPMKAIRFYQFE